MKRLRLLYALAILASIPAAPRSGGAQLVVGDFLHTGDRFLVLDQATNTEWLTPVYTQSHAYNDLFIQSLTSAYGFRYATAAEAKSMITLNFNNPTSVADGDAAGFASAELFLETFGIAQMIGCGVGPCPRTQGWTSDVGRPGTHLAEGMIQYGSTGWALYDLEQDDNTITPQIGSWLVRSTAVTTTPEPASLVLFASGFVGLLAVRRTMRVRS
jgi:hypothetical protein